YRRSPCRLRGVLRTATLWRWVCRRSMMRTGSTHNPCSFRAKWGSTLRSLAGWPSMRSRCRYSRSTAGAIVTSIDRGLSLGKAPAFGGGYSVRIAQTAIMNVHRRWLSRPLPDRVAIYFHAVEPLQDKSFQRFIQFFLESDYAFVDAAGLCAPGFSKRI